MAQQYPRLETEKSFHYTYAEPVSEVVTRLRVLSASQGGQRVLKQELTVSPSPTKTVRLRDRFGNEVREFHHGRIESALELNLRQITECRAPLRSTPVHPSGRLPNAVAETLRANSSLVDTCEEIESVAAESAVIRCERERFEHFGRWVYRTMKFQTRVTGVRTPASEALRGRAGVCQDFTHILLALCCAAGIPARYVSGFVPGEGYMHAWAEALAAEHGDEEPGWRGFDPTHNRPTDLRYLRVAVGRDYTDISPISGSFRGSQPGVLTSWARHIVQTPPCGRLGA